MARFSRRTFLGAVGVGAGGMLAGAALTGCTDSGRTKSGGTKGGGGNFDLPTYQPAPDLDVQPFHVSETPGMENVYTENPQNLFKSVERGPASGGTITTFQLTWGDPPKPLKMNPYWEELNKRLGVSFKPQFVPQPVFDEKFSTMLASGEVPDLVFLNDQSAVNLQGVRDGAFADLSEVLSGDNILKWPNLAARKENVWKASLKDGRIFQIPSIVWNISNVISMRTDLLEQTSIGTAPRDADELFTALKEVSDLGQGPGGQKVYGINFYEFPMWRWIFKTGPDWQLDSSGKLVHVSETENYKEMLTWLSNAWNEGIFDPAAMTTNGAEIVSGTALKYDPVGGTFSAPEYSTREADVPGSKWDWLDIPGFDGDGPVITRNVPYGKSTCISAEAAKDEDRLTEILNVLDYLSAPYGSEELLFIVNGIEGHNFEFDADGNPVINEETRIELGVNYVGVTSGDNSYRAHVSTVDRAKRFSTVLENMAKNSIVRDLEGFETESATFVTKGAQLQTQWDDFERGVISGRESVDDLDSFVSRYMSQGGEQIRTEYTEVLDAQ
ncbi:extracellular solute-binding protein [Actinopolymorpha sp. B9G3]|uniref:extracellular solute-binding protein n=1 Tax=Actinopolymorpha sp. B9G3 TaxID=3158970 RepID=UPI0032D8F3B0